MVGVIIARFQTPYLHEGHRALIESVKEKHKKVVVVLGVSPVLGSKNNPLDFYTREKMIKSAYQDVVLLPLSDHPVDGKWSTNLDTLLNETFPGATFTLYGSRNSFINYYSGRNIVQELPPNGDYNATEIRESIKEQVVDSVEFRSGVIYAYSNTYAKVYPTVDVAVFRSEKKELLLGRKSNDQKWRLIGGFSDPSDESFEDAAKRELGEECGDIQVGEMNYEGSFRVNDWRYKNERDKIITMLFSTDFLSGDPAANDDIVEIAWFPVARIKSMILSGETTEAHAPLLKRLVEKYDK